MAVSNTTNTLLEQCIAIAREAGDEIMTIYESDDFGLEIKADNTPLTKADIAANKIIEAGLKEISDLPIVSEEGGHDSFDADEFWLVDPIDGTKEFVNRNGEFTVNIGLIQNEQPVLGVVYAPAIDTLYAGIVGEGAYKITPEGKEPIQAVFSGNKPVIVASRSHRDSRLDEFLKPIGEFEEINMGSSLKLCLVAEGKATMYPRFAPTSLWDTAAADAVVRAAGGSVRDADSNIPLGYNPTVNILNPFFIVRTSNQQ